MVFKIVVSDPKKRKAYQKEVEESASGLIGKKIGDKVSGGFLGLEGYELEITGGSDREGFPMRPDVEGQGRKKIVLAFPPGFHPIRQGERKRKSIRGNTVSKDVSQINMKVVKEGKKALETLFGVKEKKAEASKEGKAKVEKPAEGAKEGKPKEKAKPAEGEAKEAPKEAKAEEKKEAPAEKPEEKMGVKTLEEQEKKAEEGEIASPDKEKRDVSSSEETKKPSEGKKPKDKKGKE